MKTQAWGWLAAAVLAAGLNSSYHDGGLQWAHEIVDRIGHNTGAVLALATGRADQFMAEARMLNVGRQRPECPLAAAMADVQNSVDQSQFDRFEAMSAREQAQLVRIEADRARIETLVQAKLARIQIPAADFRPVVVKAQKIACPRVRVNIPRMPRMNIPAPVVHVEYSGPGPV
jgi:hypothetical protein